MYSHGLRFGGLLVIGAFTALLLAQLPALEQGNYRNKGMVEAFRPVKSEMLTSDRLVDELTRMTFKNRLARVGWDHSILSVDLALRSPDDPDQDIEAVRQDTAQLLRFAFAETTNVRHLLLRVFLESDESRSLLVFSDMRRSDWTQEELASFFSAAGISEQQFDSRVRLVWTSAGQNWMQSFTKSFTNR